MGCCQTLFGLLAVFILLNLCGVYQSQMVSCEIFTSVVGLKKTLQAEQQVAELLQAYIILEETRLAQLKSVAEDFDKHSKEALADFDNYVGNPIRAFHLMKKLSKEWKNFVNSTLNEEHTSKLLNDIVNTTTGVFPEDIDMTGAADALLRLQDVYNLSTSDIARGRLIGSQVAPPLSPGDCYDVASRALQSNKTARGVSWLEHALSELHNHPDPDTNTKVRQALSDVAYKQGDTRHAINLTNEWLLVEPYNQVALDLKVQYEQAQQRAEEEAKYVAVGEKFKLLCQGKETMPIPRAHELNCYYSRDHPAFLLGPAKVELLNFEPWIAVYHDIIGDEAIAKIMNLSMPMLRTAGVINQAENLFKFRVARTAWLWDGLHPHIKRTTVKSMAMTDLANATMEPLQVSTYGVGGFFTPHTDHLSGTPEDIQKAFGSKGNRIATVIYYLTDVTSGGSTVFPDIGISVKPEKGAALVWYNLLRNGEGDRRTLHAACPVISGIKWVCNKWFHDKGQLYARPCSLDPAV